MVKLIGVVIALVLAAIAFFSFPEVKETAVIPETSNVLSELSSSGVFWTKVDAASLALIPNFTEKLTSRSVFEEYSCGTLINGGFYSEEGRPIGYFVAAGAEISAFRENKLFDGVLSVNDFGTPRITRTPPQDQQVVAVQTGPVLIENGEQIALKLVRDEPRRRMVAAVTGGNELVFMAFYSTESAFSGPLLAELPEAVSKLSSDENLNIADAINLDGGSASAFITSGFSLSEASPVGSFFCAK